MANNLGNHHQHSRKRLHSKLEEYPHPNKFVRKYDAFMYIIGIGVPIITSSQVIKIWASQNASGVSIIAWSAYLVNSLPGCVWYHPQRKTHYIHKYCVRNN